MKSSSCSQGDGESLFTRPLTAFAAWWSWNADLGYADAAEMQRKSQLAAEIARAIKARRLTQEGAAELLGIDQSKVDAFADAVQRGVDVRVLMPSTSVAVVTDAPTSTASIGAARQAVLWRPRPRPASETSLTR
jgi:predicted XRE-type DNA-binding protein